MIILLIKYDVEMEESNLCKKGVLRFKGKKIILIKPSTLMNRKSREILGIKRKYSNSKYLDNN